MHSGRNIGRKAARAFCAVLMQVKAASRHWAICWHFPELRLELPMMDIVMVALAVGFFAVSIAYVYACEQL
jgi:hypothetical protein